MQNIKKNKIIYKLWFNYDTTQNKKLLRIIMTNMCFNIILTFTILTFTQNTVYFVCSKM